MPRRSKSNASSQEDSGETVTRRRSSRLAEKPSIQKEEEPSPVKPKRGAAKRASKEMAKIQAEEQVVDTIDTSNGVEDQEGGPIEKKTKVDENNEDATVEESVEPQVFESENKDVEEKVNGLEIDDNTGVESEVKETMEEDKNVSSYVMIEKDEVPPVDSCEVQEAIAGATQQPEISGDHDDEVEREADKTSPSHVETLKQAVQATDYDSLSVENNAIDGIGNGDNTVSPLKVNGDAAAEPHPAETVADN